jgi:predicted Zn-dependent peptidase
MVFDNTKARTAPDTPLPILKEEYELFTFPNGIRLAHKQVTNTRIAHCGIMLDIGSRDEGPHQQGLAHFWEHMAFKGTEKRRSHHIINSLERVGGELNAYTTKEKICFHASVLDEYFGKAADLLTDITFHSVFPEKQIERERNVILEEMAMYYDSPEDAIQDDFDSLVFEGHALGYNILGTQETVSSFTKEDLRRFINDNLDTSRIVFSSVSRFSMQKVIRIVSRLLADIPTLTVERDRSAPGKYVPKIQEVRRDLTQVQCSIGKRAYSLHDEKRLPLFVLSNLLGGPGMNSRLNLALREKHGFVYAVDAGYTPYLDTGFFSIFFGTEKKHLEKSLALIRKEFQKLREKPLTAAQLHYTKGQIMGQLAMSEESNNSFMLMMAKSLLDLQKVEPLPEIFERIRQITSKELQDVAQEVFVEDEFSQLTFLPEE